MEYCSKTFFLICECRFAFSSKKMTRDSRSMSSDRGTKRGWRMEEDGRGRCTETLSDLNVNDCVFYVLAPDENALIQCDLLQSEKNISPSVYCTCQLLIFCQECKAKRCLWLGNKWDWLFFFFSSFIILTQSAFASILSFKIKHFFLSNKSLCSFLSSWIWNDVNENGAVFPAARLPRESFLFVTKSLTSSNSHRFSLLFLCCWVFGELTGRILIQNKSWALGPSLKMCSVGFINPAAK